MAAEKVALFDSRQGDLGTPRSDGGRLEGQRGGYSCQGDEGANWSEDLARMETPQG